MSLDKPYVLVTGPEKRLKFGWWAARLMLILAGIRSCYATHATQALPHNIHAVIIGGGDDIEPEHYGLTGDAGATYDPQRDAFEMTVAKQALAAGIPVLGICRGAQLINVILGGSLYQDIRPIRRHTPNRNTIFPIKWALIESDSTLQKITRRSRIRINSLHNQAVDRLAEPMRPSAWDEDGILQAIEHPQHDFVVGVQWHPEYMPYSGAQRRLFRLLVAAAKRHYWRHGGGDAFRPFDLDNSY